uniref:Uncharacterized protein n=1 Tax=Siphoviridae sp. ctVif31 TaxID=2825532 RepID=A0A8S5Q2Z7_9CAUD|nr:MAG TPA: hypothetical protein [Siphoviridae sp. ctVif31]
MYIPCPKTHTLPLRCTILCVCLSIVSDSSPSIVPPLFNQVCYHSTRQTSV